MVKSKRLIWLFAVMVLCFANMTVLAKTVPDLNVKGSISATMMDSQEKPVGGGTLTLIRVAEVQVDDGNYTFEYTDEFKDCGISMDELESKPGVLAEALAAYAKEHGIDGKTETIGADGKISFSKVELGLYLVIQKSAAEGYHAINPFIVTVPIKGETDWEYAVNAEPKMEKAEKLPPKPDEPEESEQPSEETEQPDPEQPSNEPEKSSEDPKKEVPVLPVIPPDGSVQITPDITPSTSGESLLPKTGQLWWPVPFLAVSGMLVFAAGWLINRHEKYE